MSEKRPEIVWMAWSPRLNYLPQAASVNRYVCQEMIEKFGWSRDVKAVRVLVQQADQDAEPTRREGMVSDCYADLLARIIKLGEQDAALAAETQRADREAAEAVRLRSYDGDDTPFEAVHAQIRDGVLRAAEEIRNHDDVKAAHQIMAAAAQRAAGRLNSELKELWDVRARAERAEAALAAGRDVIVNLLREQDADDDARGNWGHTDIFNKAIEAARAFLERTATAAKD